MAGNRERHGKVAIIVVPIAHENRMRRMDGGRAAWRFSWTRRPRRLKRLITEANVLSQETAAA